MMRLSLRTVDIKKYHFDIQGSHLLFFTLLVMLGNYEPPCIVTIKMVTMFVVEAGEPLK